MGQDELLLRVPPEPAASGGRDAEREDRVTLTKPRSHSRESSGGSVTFTVHSDGSTSPKASVTSPGALDARDRFYESPFRPKTFPANFHR
jgi:hypothetical protein